MRTEPEFFLGEEVAYTKYYIYLGVTFMSLHSPYKRLHVLDFLIYMQLSETLRDNVNQYSSKGHEQKYGCSQKFKHRLLSLGGNLGPNTQ